MTTAAWIAILTTFVVAVMSPGPDFLAVLRTSLSRGRIAGFGVGAGIAVGTAIWIVVTLLGIVALINSHPTASLAVRVIGAAFLTLYGLNILKQLLFNRETAPSKTHKAPITSATPIQSGAVTNSLKVSALATNPSVWLRGFRLGFLTNTVGNPKALIFFSSLFATMVPPTISPGESLLLGILMVLYARIWFAIVAVVSSLRRFVTVYQRLQRPLDLALGALFTILGLSLLPWASLLK